MTSLRKKGAAGRIALGSALGTVLLLAPTAAAAATPDEPGTATTAAPEAPATPDAPVTGPSVAIDDSHLVVVPDAVAHAFLGEPGEKVWDIEEPADTAGLTLTGIEGPGALVIHRSGDEAATELLAHSGSADGWPADGYPIPSRPAGTALSHVARWAFTAPGSYLLTLAPTAADTDPVRRTTTLTVRVGDDALATPPPSSPPTTEPAPPVEGDYGVAPGWFRTVIPPAAGRAPALAAAESGTESVGAMTTAETADTTKAAAEKKVLEEGHIDIAARVVDGKLQIQVKDGTVAGKTTWREPSSVVLHVKPAAKKQIPAGNAFSFLGQAGAPVWLLDQVQQEDLLWPGWSTDNVEAGALKGGVKFALAKVEGPGGFALYTYDGLSGANVLFNSKDGVPDSIDVPANTHAHGGWAFSSEGVHRLTVSMTGTLANGSASTDTETLTFVVGDTAEGGSGNPPGGGSVSGSAGSGSGGSSSGTGDQPDSSGGVGTTASGGSGNSVGDNKDPSGSMASTGAGDVALMGIGAVALAAAGAALVVFNRRRDQRNGARA
ncbi:TIGR03773 family transporter-associated surface protein [Streptomyces sp. NPDC004327]|uniref:TIGR03773 family transporter-associated surface protein n=1 Tax=Streptomyces sp. NPDC004327 TaxID=3364699 RepID=UPI00368298A7